MDYIEYMRKEQEKRNAEFERNSWSIEPCNNLGESVKQYYKKNGHC